MITLSMDLDLNPGGVLPRIDVSQYDHGQMVECTLYSGGSAYTIPEGTTIYVQGTKRDNTGFMYEATWSGSVATFEITNQMTVYPGEVTAELALYSDGDRIGTINFIINIEPAALSDDTEVSETDIPIIQQLPELIASAQSAATTATAKAEEAATSATNAATSEGNASTYATNAGTSATNAATSETNAATSATNAATSETNAATSATNAATSEGNAATSATNAATSESNAETSATNAATSESNAEDSAEDSEAWAVGQRGGVDVGSTDVTYNNNAKYWALKAQEYAAGQAANISYDNTSSGLAATNVQTAIDEINADLTEINSNLTDYTVGIEVDTGKRITGGVYDDSIVYRQCFFISQVTTSGRQTIGSLSNIGEIISVSGGGYSNSTLTKVSLPSFDVTGGTSFSHALYVEVNGTSVQLINVGHSAIDNLLIILEYTH